MTEYPPALQGGGILHGISYHCGIRIKTIDYPFYQDHEKQAIFSNSHIIEIVGYAKTFTLNTCEVKKLCEGYKNKKMKIKPLNFHPDRKTSQRISQTIKQLQMIATIYKLSYKETTFTVGSLPESFFYS